MKTNAVNVSFLPSDENVTEVKQALETVVKDTNLQAKKEVIHYPYTLLGQIEEVCNNGLAKVSYVIDSKQYAHEAITTQALRIYDEQKECLLTFNEGDVTQPVITGIVQPKEQEPVIISSEEGVVLECGDTRIVLDVDGTLDLKAQHINSQAYGPYRIKGGSVKIN